MSNPSPSTIAQAIALFVRDMPRAFGDLPQLSEVEYRCFMHGVAYTIASCDDRDVLELAEEIPARIAKGGDLSDVVAKFCRGREPWWRRALAALLGVIRP